jgi:hypothetical protein
MSLNHMVTTQENEFIVNRREGHSRWLVELNDGTLCYQDDGREDCPDISGWERLRNYCQAENKYIIGLYLQFRRETIALPTGKDGYYFCNSVLSWLNSNTTFHYFVAGYLENGKIYCKKYKIPELELVEEDIRDVREDDVCLIERGQNNVS